MHLALLKLDGTRGVVSLKCLVFDNLLLCGLFEHVNTGLCISHELVLPVAFCLFLSLEDLKLVL